MQWHQESRSARQLAQGMLSSGLTGFVVVSALPNDSRYVSPASTRAPSPMGSRAESFTAGTKGTPAKSGLSDQSVQSTGMAPDAGDTASSGVLSSLIVK